MSELTAPAYAKYDEDAITSLLYRRCVSARERDTVMADGAGIWPIEIAGAVICSRCEEVAE